jgi:hypothetical protein
MLNRYTEKFVNNKSVITEIETIADFEEIIETSVGNVVFPISKTSRSIVFQLSGGADSALALYILCDIIKKYDLDVKIVPITFYFPIKADNRQLTKDIINTIKELTGLNVFKKQILINVPVEMCNPKFKVPYAETKILEVLKYTSKKFKDPTFNYNGLTHNPPVDVMNSFGVSTSEHNRSTATSVYFSTHGASPLALINKKGVFELYKKYNLIDTILPLTCSCDADINPKKETKIPCGVCWWCKEREWGLKENEII